MSQTQPVVLEALSQRALIELPTDEAQLLNTAYLDQGIVDSLGLVELITELEDSLDIRFPADALESEEFRTIRGLIAIADRLTARP